MNTRIDTRIKHAMKK